MNIKEFLEINPVFLTQIGGTFVAVCGALGLGKLLEKFVDRCWKKADEKDEDHKKVEELEAKFNELSEKMDKILDTLETMKDNDTKGFKDDLKLFECELANMQNRALVKHKVSNSCMPRYMELYSDYCKLADETEGCKASAEITLNHKRILKLVEDGHVVDTLEEWYK